MSVGGSIITRWGSRCFQRHWKFHPIRWNRTLISENELTSGTNLKGLVYLRRIVYIHYLIYSFEKGVYHRQDLFAIFSNTKYKRTTRPKIKVGGVGRERWKRSLIYTRLLFIICFLKVYVAKRKLTKKSGSLKTCYCAEYDSSRRSL